MKFTREVLGLPVPRILGWCSNADGTLVKSEYIFMERVKGVPLYKVFDDLSAKELSSISEDVVEIEKRLCDLRVPMMGSLYLREHMPSDTTTPVRLGLAYGEKTDDYCIGPSVEKRFWRGGRKDLKFDRGPCQCRLVLTKYTTDATYALDRG
jgi:hypothetical protein